MSNLVSDELVMKSLPGDPPSSARQRKCPQGPTSIYVPPPLRKRKNSSDPKKSTSNVSQKSKIIAGRGISLNLNNPPTKISNKSKKCENSYMLFGLEDMSKTSVKSAEKISTKSQSNEGRESVVTSSNIKKCDNSYLLFSSDSTDPKFESSNCSNKKNNERFPRKSVSNVKSETNEPFKSFSTKTAPLLSDEDSHSGIPSDNLVRVKSFETIIAPYLPEELSFELDSLSVGNKSQCLSVSNNCSRENIKPVKQSSQKKCDNSSFLFEDDDDYSSHKSLRSHPKDKLSYFQGIPSTQSFGDNYSSASKLTSVSSSNESKKSDPSSSIVIPNNPVSEAMNKERSKEVLDNINTFNNGIPGDEISDDQSTNIKTPDKLPDTQISSNFNADISDSIEDYVVEIYDFPKTLRTQDIMTIFSSYVQDGFFIKWVDDTHALGIFSNSFSVSDVLKKSFDLISVRPLQSASAASIEIAGTLPVPSASRPRTCPSLARRLVSGALGLKVSVSDEIRQAEKKMLQEAKEERRLAAKLREEAWEGTLRSSLGT